VNYRDHPPQDSSYVTEVHDFTSSPNTMKGWLTNTSASGGGDLPEAVADALHDVLKLSWRDEATKICVCISDAPPHGLPGCGGDGFPEGCPAGIDPIKVVKEMAEKGITLYVAGCEPSITPYKNFFMAIAYITGGQYVPLSRAKVLSQVIVGGAQEELSLEQLMEEVNEEVQADMAAGRTIDEEEMSRRVHTKMMAKGIRSKQMFKNNANLTSAGDVPMANALSKLDSFAAVQTAFKPEPSSSSFGGFGSGGAPYMEMGRGAPPPVAMMQCPLPATAHAESFNLSAPAPEPSSSSFGGFGASGAPYMAMGRGAPHMAMGWGLPPPGAMLQCPLPPSAHAESYNLSAPAPEEEDYECRESEITYDQASRMVKKSLARHQVVKK